MKRYPANAKDTAGRTDPVQPVALVGYFGEDADDPTPIPVAIVSGGGGGGGDGGGLTDDELRATPLEVAIVSGGGEGGGGGGLTDDELRATPVAVEIVGESGGLTDTELRATPLEVELTGPILRVTDDGNGNDIHTLAVSISQPADPVRTREDNIGVSSGHVLMTGGDDTGGTAFYKWAMVYNPVGNDPVIFSPYQSATLPDDGFPIAPGERVDFPVGLSGGYVMRGTLDQRLLMWGG